MDKPNSAICARRFARTPEAEWGAKQICFIFPSTSHLCSHKPRGDGVGQPCPTGHRQDPGDSAALGMGWEAVEYTRSLC